MRLWTLQPLLVLERVQQEGELKVDPENVPFFNEFRDDYDWMRSQMLRRLEEYHGGYPWWAYDYKVDLRRFRPSGETPTVRLELEIPSKRVLLSAYGAWHFVLNRWYLPHAVDEAGYDEEERKWDDAICQAGLKKWDPLPEPWRSRMTESWERIFDVDDLRSTNTIQACFETLKLGDVVKVTNVRPL